MTYELAIGIISYKTINVSWLKELRDKVKNAYLIVIFDEPKDLDVLEYCDSLLVHKSALGFCHARRLSMLLTCEYSKYCVVTDGDGQYPVESIIKISEEIQKTKDEIIIPQRTNKLLQLEYNGERFDRSQIEFIENLCALKRIDHKDIANIDMQPGLFAFKRSILNLILPNNSGWLADLEISMNAIKKTKYQLLPLRINEEAQKTTTFSIKTQIEKFNYIKNKWKINIQGVLKENQKSIKEKEFTLIRKLLTHISD